MLWQHSLTTELTLAQLAAEQFHCLVMEYVKAFYFANEFCMSVLETICCAIMETVAQLLLIFTWNIPLSTFDPGGKRQPL